MFCSAQCKARDTGKQTLLRTIVPVHLTSQLPVTLSPHFRPHSIIQPSPRMPPHGRPSSSSSSSTADSPLQSPATNPIDSGSPQKDPLDLGPPAFPHAQQPFSGSVPVKIAALPRATVPAPPPTASHGTTYGTSIDTLRFGRKPALINSVTSPNALIARCACGKPANHAMRGTSKERGESEFSRLSLGPTVLQHRADRHRMVSESSPKSSSVDRRAVSGHGTPPFPPTEIEGVGSSALSRSRSDPMHPKLYTTRATPVDSESPLFHPRRASNAASRPSVADRESGGSDRGRSRERMRHEMEVPHGGLLNHPPEREPAPSRSRHRREEREREKSRRERASPSLPPMDQAAIMPSWNRALGADDGIAPRLLRNGWRSPKKS